MPALGRDAEQRKKNSLIEATLSWGGAYRIDTLPPAEPPHQQASTAQQSNKQAPEQIAAALRSAQLQIVPGGDASPAAQPLTPGDVQSSAECLAFFGFLAAFTGALSAFAWLLQGMPPV